MNALDNKSINHYEWMLKNLNLTPLHRAWVIKQISILKAGA